MKRYLMQTLASPRFRSYHKIKLYHVDKQKQDAIKSKHEYVPNPNKNKDTVVDSKF